MYTPSTDLNMWHKNLKMLTISEEGTFGNLKDRNIANKKACVCDGKILQVALKKFSLGPYS